MMKHKKYIIGVLVFIIMLGVGVCGILDVSASAVPTTCDNANKLHNYYDIDIDNDGMRAVISSKHGTFKIIALGGGIENLVTNSFSLDSSGYYYLVDGKEAIVSPNSSITLTFNNANAADDSKATIALAIAKPDKNTTCDTWEAYQKRLQEIEKAKREGKKVPGNTVHTFETGAIEMDVLSGAKAAYAANEYSEPNQLYNYDLCQDLRNTADANERNYYAGMVPNCFSEYASSYAEDTDENRKAIKNEIKIAKDTWKIIGESTFDEGDAGEWGFEFDRVANTAKSNGNAYYAERQDNQASIFYTLTNDSKKGSKIKDRKDFFELQCKHDTNGNDISIFDQYKNGKYNIDANTKQFYARDEVEQKISYKWKYTSGKTKTEAPKTVCTRVCEEALEVKYGPPVASKAGLCFEYEIQVTSRVKCTADIKTDAKPKKPKVCNPIPICNNIPGYTHQAGPSEDFENCINSCDGGKYTKKCSDKCYKSVYGKSNKTAMLDNTTSAKKVVNRIYAFYGKYYYSGNVIHWTSGESGVMTYSRYYKEYGYGPGVHGPTTYLPVDGFKKRVVGDGFCKDPCRYTNCGKKTFLNKSERDEQYKANLNEYYEKVKACKAAAKCVTNQATFKIWVSYIDGASVKRVVDFPYTKSADKPPVYDQNFNANPTTLDTNGDNTTVCDGNEGKAGTTSIVKNGIGGCYLRCGADGKRTKYHTRWHIPATWINAKYGDISYVAKDTTGWNKKANSFCIPLDAKDVNQKWWNYYYSRYIAVHGDTSMNATYKNGEKCSMDAGSPEVSDWNIRGTAEKFGYYGWNISVKCFYALNKKYTNGSPCTTNNGGGDGTSTTTPYRIRSVDLNNLFPASDGKVIATAEETGRTPGYNWSQFATNTKNSAYTSHPNTYLAEVQREAYNVYNDKNKDYEFVLSRSVLGKLKTKDKNYTSFADGEMVDANGIKSYKSKVIRDLANAGAVNVAGNSLESLVGCNNIKNGQCN